MTEKFLERLFEHNNWANLKIIEVCTTLSDEQLDAKPQSVVMGKIRETLTHLVSSQNGYLSLLTLPVAERKIISPAFNRLDETAKLSWEKLTSLARDTSRLTGRLQTTDNYLCRALGCDA